MSRTKMKPLNIVLFNLVFVRLIIPISLLFLIVVFGMGYIRAESVRDEQDQKIIYITKSIDNYVEQSLKMLDAIGKSKESSNDAELLKFMENIWESYRFFDTIYALNSDAQIESMVPFDNRYLMVALTNISNIKSIDSESEYIISKPFISLRTGEPTVYIIKATRDSGYILGELNLSGLNPNIAEEGIFVMDEFGNLIVHNDKNMVKQQVNLSNLFNINESSNGVKNHIYDYNNEKMIASSLKTEKANWTVVSQMPLMLMLRPYIWTLNISIMILLFIWFIVGMNVSKKLDLNIIMPIESLNQRTNAISRGDYSNITEKSKSLSSFKELSELSNNFDIMTNSLISYQTDLEFKVEERTAEITAMNEELIATNEELSETYEQLKIAQQQLIESEKLSALGSLVAGIAHEINTPIGVAYTASSYLDELNKKIYSNFNQNKISKSQFEAYLEASTQTTDILNSNLKRSIDLIKSFKAIDISYHDDEKRYFDLSELIDDFIKTMQDQFDKLKIEIVKSYQNNIIINSYPSAITQILVNLISNSIIHGFEGAENKKITISVEQYDDTIKLIISDNGRGIPENLISKIFDPFFTSNRNEQNRGLGLNIIYNLIKGQLNGDIKCQSKIGFGTTFVISFKV